MAVYKQIDTYVEDGFGTVTIEFVLTDDPRLLFTQTNAKEVDIFTLGSVKEDLDKGAGIPVETEFQFEMSGARIQTADDEECFHFALLAESQKLYMAVYINPTSTGDVHALVFSGVIKQEVEGSDLLWSGNQWDTAIIPLREWRFKARSIEMDIMNIALDDVQQGNTVTPGLLTQVAQELAPSTWTEPRPMYVSPHDPSTTIHIPHLISLNTLLSTLFTKAKELSGQPSEMQLRREVGMSGISFAPAEPIFPSYRPPFFKTVITGYSVPKSEFQHLSLLGQVALQSEPYINWLLVNPSSLKEEKEHSFRRYKTLADLCYALATCFGCYFRAERTSAAEISYSFVSRNLLGGGKMYIRDAVKGEISISSTVDNDRLVAYKGAANNYAVEGVDVCDLRATSDSFIIAPSPAKVEETKTQTQKRELLTLSVSPTLRSMGENPISGEVLFYPLNTTSLHPPPSAVQAWERVHTAIYFQYRGWFRPAIQARINIEGQEHSFRTLADCANFITERDQAFYEREYTVEVPWLCGAFSSNSNGNNPSWQACSLGVTVTLDNKDYSVIGIERNLEKRSTKLRLQAASRFAFAPAAPGGEPETYIPTLPSAPPVEQGTVEYAIADEQIRTGDAVGISPEGKLFRMSANAANYNLFAGIAIEDRNQDEETSFAANGAIVNNSSWNWTPGASIYVRTTTAPDSNLSHTYLAQYSASEDMFLRIGIALSPTRILIGDIEEFIYEYEAAL